MGENRAVYTWHNRRPTARSTEKEEKERRGAVFWVELGRRQRGI